MKLYFSKLRFTLTTHSHFHLNHELLINYTEEANVTVQVVEISSLTFFLKLSVDKQSKGLRIQIQEVILSAEGKDI